MTIIEEYISRVVKALVYIEAHIEEEMTLDELAKISCYSPFHFHRIFQSVVGETVYQYVKRLRLERAASRLRNTTKPVTDIALEASYDTPSAFTKAFKQSMGISPKEYRRLHAAVHVTCKTAGAAPALLPDTIEKLADIELFFSRKTGSYQKTPWAAWEAMNQLLLDCHIDTQSVRRFGISHDDPHITKEDKIRYDACILPLAHQSINGLGRQVLKGGKYAVFTHIGPYETLEETWHKILLQWLPVCSEKLDDTRPSFDEYINMEYYEKENEKVITKLYIPIY